MWGRIVITANDSKATSVTIATSPTVSARCPSSERVTGLETNAATISTNPTEASTRPHVSGRIPATFPQTVPTTTRAIATIAVDTRQAVCQSSKITNGSAAGRGPRRCTRRSPLRCGCFRAGSAGRRVQRSAPVRQFHGDAGDILRLEVTADQGFDLLLHQDVGLMSRHRPQASVAKSIAASCRSSRALRIPALMPAANVEPRARTSMTRAG